MKKNSWFFAGMLAVVLVFSLAVIGCENDADAGYKFYFKVENMGQAAITKVELINGTTENDKVLDVKADAIDRLEVSSPYDAGGFTVKNADGRRYCGVKVTFDNGKSAFGYNAFYNDSKIIVNVSSTPSVSLTKSSW
jgi:hypothetical protein